MLPSIEEKSGQRNRVGAGRGKRPAVGSRPGLSGDKELRNSTRRTESMTSTRKERTPKGVFEVKSLCRSTTTREGREGRGGMGWGSRRPLKDDPLYECSARRESE